MQDKIQEIMGLLNAACDASWDAGEASASGGMREFNDKCAKRNSAMDEFESKLRELVREPLDAHEVGCLVETAAYLSTEAMRRADFINGIRYAERAHGITKEGGE